MDAAVVPMLRKVELPRKSVTVKGCGVRNCSRCLLMLFISENRTGLPETWMFHVSILLSRSDIHFSCCNVSTYNSTSCSNTFL